MFQVPLECPRPPLTFSQDQLVCARGIHLNRSCAACQQGHTPLTLPPCAMSRGRGGHSREQYPRHPPPNLPAKETYYRPGPPLLFPRPRPQHAAFASSYHDGSSHSAVHFQQPAPFPNASAPPLPSHDKVVSNLASSSSSYSPQHCPAPGTKAFHDQQVAFLKQTRELPRFRSDLPFAGTREVTPARPSTSSYQPYSGYDRYSNPTKSYRTHNFDSQEQSFRYPPNVRAPRTFPDPRFVIQSQVRGQKHSTNSSRLWGPQTDCLSDAFQRFTLQDKSQRGEQFDRYEASSYSPNVSFAKVNITLNPAIQDQVHAALFALQQSESVSAKSLAKKLRLPKNVVNRALYSLERSEKASKQGQHPPKWTLYKEPSLAVTSILPVPQQHRSEQPLETGPELERDFHLLQVKKEVESDTESSLSDDSESTDYQEPAGSQQRPDRDYPCTALSADQDPKPPAMTDQKELIFQYLLHSQEATSLVIAKNLGLRNAKQVNPTLYALEKLGDVVRNKQVSPHTWELSAHRRARMERSLKATQCSHSEFTPMELEGLGLGFHPSSPLPPLPSLELLPLSEGLMSEQNNSERVSCFSVSIFHIVR